MQDSIDFCTDKQATFTLLPVYTLKMKFLCLRFFPKKPKNLKILYYPQNQILGLNTKAESKVLKSYFREVPSEC